MDRGNKSTCISEIYVKKVVDGIARCTSMLLTPIAIRCQFRVFESFKMREVQFLWSYLVGS